MRTYTINLPLKIVFYGQGSARSKEKEEAILKQILRVLEHYEDGRQAIAVEAFEAILSGAASSITARAASTTAFEKSRSNSAEAVAARRAEEIEWCKNFPWVPRIEVEDEGRGLCATLDKEPGTDE